MDIVFCNMCQIQRNKFNFFVSWPHATPLFNPVFMSASNLRGGVWEPKHLPIQMFSQIMKSLESGLWLNSVKSYTRRHLTCIQADVVSVAPAWSSHAHMIVLCRCSRPGGTHVLGWRTWRLELPQHSGTVTRDFRAIKDDTAKYCMKRSNICFH